MSRRTTPTPRTLGGAAFAIVVAVGLWLFAGQDDNNGGDTASATTAEAVATTADAVPAATTAESVATTVGSTTAEPDPTAVPDDGFDRVALADLPPEAGDTLELIDSGGPFPYRQDDQEFQNREGILPDRPPGYYREYTVETPGSDDRGARRIITGDDGETYYTDDHYESFRRVER